VIDRSLPSFGDLALGLELVDLLGRLDEELSVGNSDDVSTTAGELGGDVLVRVRGRGGLDDDWVRAASRGRVDAEGLDGIGSLLTGGRGVDHLVYLLV
jgi:hypothetical protein